MALARGISIILAVSAALPAAGHARAQLKDENLLIGVPPGFKVAYQDKKPQRMIVEMLPQDQTLKSWDEMITVQIFYRRGDLGVTQFREEIRQGWMNACPDGDFAPLRDGRENGYTFEFWSLYCPKNPETGAPEMTYFKAIQGNDAFYSIQKAFRVEPADSQIIEWTKFASKVLVCDTRLPDRPCPKK
jgi:hypothetical protein